MRFVRGVSPEVNDKRADIGKMYQAEDIEEVEASN